MVDLSVFASKIMGMKHFIMVISILGFFLMSKTDVVACEAGHCCCKKEVKKSNSTSKKCCNSESTHHKKEESSKKCNDKSCQCLSFSHLAIPNLEPEFRLKSVFITSLTGWYYLDKAPQSIYLSLRLPPKISC